MLTSFTKIELNSLRNIEITYYRHFLAVATKQKSEMTSYLNNGHDVMNYFAKFENRTSWYNQTKFYDCRTSNARVTLGGFYAPPHIK